MRNAYEDLELTSDASFNDIKKSYRRLALKYHPDHGGDEQKMSYVNSAYESIGNPDARRHYDQVWLVYQNSNLEQEASEIASDVLLQSGNVMPFSHSYRQEHAAFISKFRVAPLERKTQKELHPIFLSDHYSIERAGRKKQTFHDIFSFIRYRNAAGPVCNASIPPTNLTAPLAISVLKDFLSGYYYGASLIRLKGYFSAQIHNSKTLDYTIYERSLYNAIYEIILKTELSSEEILSQNTLINSVQKITDFAINTLNSPEQSQLNIIPLLYSKNFRNLFNHSIFIYWQCSNDLFNSEAETQRVSYQESKEHLSGLRDRLVDNTEQEGLKELIQSTLMFYGFEKMVYQSSGLKTTAREQREGAFRCLDWFTILKEHATKEILVNVFLQLGRQFQKTSTLEESPVIKMADEKLASNMYMMAMSIGMHDTPDVELYSNLHILKYISNFQFKDDNDLEQLEAIKKRTLMISDIFPFFNKIQSITSIHQTSHRMLPIMRNLLNSMVEIIENNRTKPNEIINIEHSTVSVLYQAYEACLKNWYKETYQPEVEKKIRLELMEELLFGKGWTYLDVEQNLTSPWVFIDRDEDGWMVPTRLLPYNEDSSIVKYRSINGVEINQTTGEINFLLEPWTPERPGYEKVFTLFDLQEMLEKNLSAAFFSLDLVDPSMPYHPFNSMRFGPKQLSDSELFNSMLLTDYILKFLTINQEVQGQYPFDQRSSSVMIEHLPAYLKKIIENFQNSPRGSGSLHRFWIEAEETDVSSFDNKKKQTYGINSLKMIVKKHRMERDTNGELKDVSNDDEGWPIYVLTEHQMSQLQQGLHKIDGPAMIFIHAKTQLYYYENNNIIKSHVPENYRTSLIRLYNQPREINGEVKFNFKNMPLIYKITNDMAVQAGLSNRYSPEFIFSQEFTLHYDEFSQYLPEFGRLKELCKISILVRLLDSHRQCNKLNIDALNYLINPTFVKPDTDVYIAQNEVYEKNKKSLVSFIDTIRSDINSASSRPNYSEKTQIVDQVKQKLSASSTRDIRLALFDNDSYALNRIAEAELKSNLRKQNKELEKLNNGFKELHLGDNEEGDDNKDTCFWVPASVRHDGPSNDSGISNRHSFFSYGGVNLQPRINMVNGGNRPGGTLVGRVGFNNVNAQAAMQNKLSALQNAQSRAVKTQTFSDGRVRYYGAERASKTQGPTRGNAHVTEYNPRTGQVRAWAESRDHQGNVNRVHPKMIDGRTIYAKHYPPTGAEIRRSQGLS